MTNELIKLYERDLDKLEKEIKAFDNEENLWRITGDIRNPAGNLCLHLCGNLNTFIGQQLGQSGYVRNREFEFKGKDVPQSELIDQVKSTKNMVTSVLKNIQPEDFSKPYPLNFLGYEMTVGYCLTHLYGHFSYHLGQINYLRRILE